MASISKKFTKFQNQTRTGFVNRGITTKITIEMKKLQLKFAAMIIALTATFTANAQTNVQVGGEQLKLQTW